MIRSTRWLTATAVLAVLTIPLAAAAPQAEFDTFDRPSVRILQDYTLRAGETAREVVVIGGDARIEGHVTENVVVILGKAELTSTAVVDGTFVAVAGTAEIADGAKVREDFVVVGDANTAPSFAPGGQHVVIGTAGLGTQMRSMVPWLTHGLLLGRPIVPWLGWVWLVAGVFFFLNLCLNLIFDAPVRACATTLRETPFSAFIAGLLVMLLFGPVCVLLAVSVIGIAVVPFVLCAIVAASIIGRVGFARWLGMSLVAQSDPEDRAQSTRSFLIGSVLMGVTYMIPFIGFVVWILAGVFGLGSATLAFYAKYRRENPKRPKKGKGAPLQSDVAPGDLPLQVDAVDPALQTDDVVVIPHAVDLPPEGGTYGSGGSQPGAGDQPLGNSYTRSAGPVAYPKATFSERLAALGIDLVVVGIIAQLLSLDRHSSDGRLVVLLALVYHVSFWTWRGTTLGGIICQLRVVRTDGRPLDFPESLIRGITGIISLVIAGLGFFWILRDPDRQGWHDRVAGTFVIKVPRAYPV